METLGRDLQADEDEDRQDRRAGNRLVEVGKRAGEAGNADEGRRGERVGRAAPHRLVSGVANVGRGLDHATAGTGDDRCDPLDADDGAGVVFITGRCSALGAVDAPDHRAECEGDHDRQIFHGIAPGLQPLESEGRQPFHRPERGPGVDRGMRGTRGDPAGGGANRMDHATDQEGGQRAGDPCRKRNPRRQRRQHDAQ